MKWIHIAAGLLSLLTGFVALYATKGGTTHRAWGKAFAVAMATMTGSAFIAALLLNPNRGNQVAAALTFYLVASGVLTVRGPVAAYRGWTAALMVLAFATSARAFDLGFMALDLPRGVIDQIPAAPIFMFAVVGLVAALMDARLLWVGRIEGKHRLARHLWRMTYAFWVAVTSAFLGQAKFVPEPFRDFRLLAVPVLLVAATGIYWLVRVLWTRRGIARSAARMPARAQPAG
jgi:uncharacterized membrane protein